MSRITLSRSRSVEESRAVALLRLDQYEFKQGEPVVIYYRDGDNVDYIYAIGTGEGKGWYKIITTGQQTIIWSVETSLPDISTLIHGEVRLYNDENGDWYTVRAVEDETTGDTIRQIRILSSVPKIFINIQDNSIWVSDEDRKARRINSIYTKEEINELKSKNKDLIKYVFLDEEEIVENDEINDNKELDKKLLIDDVPQFMKEEEKISSSKKGTLMHLCMQKMVESKNYSIDDIKGLIQNLVFKNIISEKEAEAININQDFFCN